MEKLLVLVLIWSSVVMAQFEKLTPILPYYMLVVAEAPFLGEEENPLVIAPTLCPFILKLQGGIESFTSKCDVYKRKEGVLIPPNCQFSFKLKNYKTGVLINPICPTILLYQPKEGLEV